MPACSVLSVISVLFMFHFCSCYVSYVLFVSFVVCLLYCLSHHLQGRVHDSEPMGGHDSDSTVGPGYFSSIRRGLLCFALLFVFFFFIFCFSFFFSEYLFALLLLCIPIYFLLLCLFLSLFCRSFFSLSVYRRSWRMYVVPVIAQHNGMASY